MRFKVTVSYDGTNYCGWQIQPNGISIQEVIEKVLKKITKVETLITSSGRTDASVHAIGQVFHFDSDLKMNVIQWKKALNSLLPKDIYVIKVERVKDNFHARYDALWKKYVYTINCGEYDVLNHLYEYEYNKPLDIKAMIKASKYLEGTHNFAAFNANDLKERPNQVRTIYSLKVIKVGDKIQLEFIGNGFLRYMVRMISQTLIEVGKKKITPSRVKELVNQGRKNSAPYNAVANGLCLVEVGYSEFKPID